MTPTQALTAKPHQPVAPAWHTVVVVVLMLGISFMGSRTRSFPGVSAYGHIVGYLLVMVVEWVTVAFIWFGIRRRGIAMSELVGGKWARPRAVLLDVAIAIGFLIIAALILNGIQYLLKAVQNPAIRSMFPHGPAEIFFYLLLVATAGFCEELIFRGYLQRQFNALTHAAAGGIVLQGLVFGASHGYQGWKFMLIIAVFGMMFGLLAYWRRSLRPGMIAHFLQDGLGGLLGPHLH